MGAMAVYSFKVWQMHKVLSFGGRLIYMLTYKTIIVIKNRVKDNKPKKGDKVESLKCTQSKR